ncbi:stage III sporulation protein AA [Acutalibacter sp. 1XD8-33]|uniref:stage III sporulation protein AA n=1 Tax=Acutalibacter sp. 1XD8-33 TaxID=2320081 RepID=UPI000EA07054|nr:stage III sporulation protein AA [Acutalibacter sp. 1XD8-33]RKJ39621.1 stage III sporulation protein AA [Acutalibacter sp. 1XD8-33]
MKTMGFDAVAGRLPLYGKELLALPGPVKDQAFDIRFSVGQPVTVCGREGAVYLRESGGMSRALEPGLATVFAGDIKELFFSVCGHSVFSHENEIREGYVNWDGLCRVGVCGTAVTENHRVKALRDITSLVFRIPRDVPGCGDRLFQKGVDPARGLLIAGEPSSGKTTFLRDVARSLSLGRFGPSRRVAVLDCRGELGGFDLGPCADILRGYPKAEAFDAAIRTLSPEVLVCDELAPQDLEPVLRSVYAGVGLVATVHAQARHIKSRPLCRELLDTGAFQTLAVLAGRGSPGRLAYVEVEREFRRESWAG